MTFWMTLLIVSLSASALGACRADDPPASAADATIVASDTSTAGVKPAGPRRVMVNGIDLTGVGYDYGNPSASVVVVNFSDFGCPFCGSFARETQPSLDREFVATGKVFFKYVPFVMGMFPNGEQAARAGECAGDQGKFQAMHDRLYAEQKEWKSSRSPESILKKYAAGIGLDAARFAACYAGGTTHQRTALATDRADRLGIRATPTFYVNGYQIEGALPLEDFRRVLSRATQ